MGRTRYENHFERYESNEPLFTGYKQVMNFSIELFAIG